MSAPSAHVELLALIATRGINTSNKADWLRYSEAARELLPDNVTTGISAEDRYAPQAIWAAANLGNARLAQTRMMPANAPPPASQTVAYANWLYEKEARIFEANSDTMALKMILATMSAEMIVVVQGLAPNMIGIKPWTMLELITLAALRPISNHEAQQLRDRLDYIMDPEEKILTYRARIMGDTGTLGGSGRLNGWEAIKDFMKGKLDKIPGGRELYDKYIEQPQIRKEENFTIATLFEYLEHVWEDRPRHPPAADIAAAVAAHAAPAAAAAAVIAAAAAAPLLVGLVAAGNGGGYAPNRTASTVANRLSIANGSNAPSAIKPARAHTNYCFLHGWTGPKGHIGTSCNDLRNDGNATAAMKTATAPATLNAKDRVAYVGCVRVF